MGAAPAAPRRSENPTSRAPCLPPCVAVRRASRETGICIRCQAAVSVATVFFRERVLTGRSRPTRGGREMPRGHAAAPHPADVTGCDRVSSPFRKGQLRFRNKHGKEKERRGGGSLYFHLLAKGRKGFSPQRSSSCTPRGQSVGGTAGDIHQGRKVLEGGADCDCRKEETAPPHGVPRDQEKETHVCGLPGPWRAQDPRTGGRGGPGLGGLCKMPGAELCRGSSRGGGSEPRQGGTPPGSTWGSPKLPVLGDTPEMRKG